MRSTPPPPLLTKSHIRHIVDQRVVVSDVQRNRPASRFIAAINLLTYRSVSIHQTDNSCESAAFQSQLLDKERCICSAARSQDEVLAQFVSAWKKTDRNGLKCRQETASVTMWPSSFTGNEPAHFWTKWAWMMETNLLFISMCDGLMFDG